MNMKTNQPLPRVYSMCRGCRTECFSHWIPIKPLTGVFWRLTCPSGVCFCNRWWTVSIQRMRKAQRSRWRSSTATPSAKWRRKSWTPSTRTFLTPTAWRPPTWTWVQIHTCSPTKINKNILLLVIYDSYISDRSFCCSLTSLCCLLKQLGSDLCASRKAESTSAPIDYFFSSPCSNVPNFLKPEKLFVQPQEKRVLACCCDQSLPSLKLDHSFRLMSQSNDWADVCLVMFYIWLFWEVSLRNAVICLPVRGSVSLHLQTGAQQHDPRWFICWCIMSCFPTTHHAFYGLILPDRFSNSLLVCS